MGISQAISQEIINTRIRAATTVTSLVADVRDALSGQVRVQSTLNQPVTITIFTTSTAEPTGGTTLIGQFQIPASDNDPRRVTFSHEEVSGYIYLIGVTAVAPTAGSLWSTVDKKVTNGSIVS